METRGVRMETSRDKTVRSQHLPESGYKRLREGLNLEKGRVVRGADFHSRHNDFKFPVRFRRRAQQTAGNDPRETS